MSKKSLAKLHDVFLKTIEKNLDEDNAADIILEACNTFRSECISCGYSMDSSFSSLSYTERHCLYVIMQDKRFTKELRTWLTQYFMLDKKNYGDPLFHTKTARFLHWIFTPFRLIKEAFEADITLGIFMTTVFIALAGFVISLIYCILFCDCPAHVQDQPAMEISYTACDLNNSPYTECDKLNEINRRS